MSSAVAPPEGPPSEPHAPRKGRRTRWGQSASEAATEAEQNRVANAPVIVEPSLPVTIIGPSLGPRLIPADVVSDDHLASEPSAEAKPAVVAAAAAAAAGAAAANSTAHLVPPGMRVLAKPVGAPGAPTASSHILSDVATRAAAARAALEKAKKALALQKQIQEQVTAMRSGKGPSIMLARGANAMVTAGVAAALRALPQSKPMRFDRLGREVDAEGKVIEIKPVAHSTLKVNINKEREAKLKQVAFQARVDRSLTNPATNPWFDPALGVSGPKVRSKGLSFVEKGFYAKRERQMRAREQAQSMGLRLATGSAEDKKRREDEEQEKLRRLLDYQRAQDEQNGDEQAEPPSDSHPTVDTNGPIHRPHDSASFLHSLSKGGASEDEALSDDGDSGVLRRQEALHILQRRQLGIIPDVEWWDQPLLRRQAEMDRLDDEDPEFPYVIAETAITDLIEHPVPIAPVVDMEAHAPTMFHLTPKEREKLRRRKRQEREKDKQDKIRMGLMAPPPPKVKLANLMRVLGKSAVADPSRVEAQVKEQVAARLKAHQERNEARRLDADARRKKTIAKWTQPSSEAQVPPGGAEVCVFSIKDLSNRGYLFKVDKNAQQFHVTGAAIVCPQHGNLVIVEGNRKALRGYKKLLLRRIKWPVDTGAPGETEAMDMNLDSSGFGPPEAHDVQRDDENINPVLQGRGSAFCKLLWEGIVKERAFKQWRVYVCKSEAEVRKLLADRHSEHYWDMLRKYRDPHAELL